MIFECYLRVGAMLNIMRVLKSQKNSDLSEMNRHTYKANKINRMRN